MYPYSTEKDYNSFFRQNGLFTPKKLQFKNDKWCIYENNKIAFTLLKILGMFPIYKDDKGIILIPTRRYS